MEQLVNLAVVGPYKSLFTYKVHPDDAIGLTPGCRFLVPFGGGHALAFIVEPQTTPVPHRLRFVKERIDLASPFPTHLFELCRWIAEYYFAGLGETLSAALPGSGGIKGMLEYCLIDRDLLEKVAPGDAEAYRLALTLLKRGKVSHRSIVQDKKARGLVQVWLGLGAVTAKIHEKQARKKLLGYQKGGTADLRAMVRVEPLASGEVYSIIELAGNFGLSASQVRRLVKKGALDAVHDEGNPATPGQYPIRVDLPSLELLPAQKNALTQITEAMDVKSFAPFLLFGITGSGKTLVYCHAARKAIVSGGTVLVLVPEISLSGILLSSFAAFFGDQVGIIHSGLTPGQREAFRHKVASGEIKIVIGPRSAIFSPLTNLRLIIVDEEHDPSYKQDNPAPRYHARDSAVMLARLTACPIVLGSASPSIESYYNAVNGRYTLLTLDQRPLSGYTMPKITALDMKSEKIDGDCSFLSYRLKAETEKHISAGGQVIYYLNRRGFAARLKCHDCGRSPTCPDCGITYTYHRDGHRLKCHFCDRTEPAPSLCAQCGSMQFAYIGAGTQRVEDNLSRLFADVRAQRIDSDRTASKSGRLILSDFAAEKFDLLVGTQMVTKGLDIPNVTLVGVLSADIGLEMPDFRAAEKTYARLLQVAGRAGRGEREGVVIIQTHNPDHFVIKHLTEGEYVHFYDTIITDRRELNYPPFMRLINITLSSPDEKLLEKEALAFRIKLESYLTSLPKFQLLGPAPAPLYKLRGHFRRRLFIKCRDPRPIIARFRAWESDAKNFALPAKIKIIFDIDPVDMM